MENSGGGAYDAGCYDEETQSLFDDLNEEKRERYFDEHPYREEEYDGDMHRVYDRYAGFKMDMNLNKAADHRLDVYKRQSVSHLIFLRQVFAVKISIGGFLFGVDVRYFPEMCIRDRITWVRRH